MRTTFDKIKNMFKEDKLFFFLALFYLLCLFSSFWRDAVFSIQVPLIGSVFLYRVYLAICMLLYFIWAVKRKDKIWTGVSILEKSILVFIIVLLIYSCISLLWAIDFVHSFKKLFNLFLDLLFFFLSLRLCRNKTIRSISVAVAAVGLFLIALIGIYEVFRGGVFNTVYDIYKRFTFGQGTYQFPVVSFGNTNDYAMSVLFYFCIILLFLLSDHELLKSKKIIFIPIAFGIIYFLVAASSARLVMLGFWILFIGFAVYMMIANTRKWWTILLTIGLIASISFVHQYRYIVPSIKQYVEVKYKELTQKEETEGEERNVEIILGDPNAESLSEQFFETDEVTGEAVLRDTGSAGARASLLIHCWNCFKESKGMGVGIGNTEKLAESRKVAHNSQGKYYSSIHCFIARLISDYGIFALLPLCLIAILLIKQIFERLKYSISIKKRFLIAWAVLLFFTICVYPIVSTASSDAQDSPAMWYFLSMIVVMAIDTSTPRIPVECDGVNNKVSKN